MKLFGSPAIYTSFLLHCAPRKMALSGPFNGLTGKSLLSDLVPIPVVSDAECYQILLQDQA